MAHKITMTVVRIIEPDPQYYGTADPQKMLDIDLAGANSDYMLFLDANDVQISVVGELLGESS